MKKQSPIIYIAGPYRNPTISGVNRNIHTARIAAEHLAAHDIFFLCPHLNSGLMDGINTDEYFLAMGLELLSRCDYMLLIGDWRNSDGSCMEKELARKLEIPVFESVSKLIKFLS
jgi:hypothetical protein